jgi:hypothetical protein
MVASIGGGIEWIPPIDLFILNIFWVVDKW